MESLKEKIVITIAMLMFATTGNAATVSLYAFYENSGVGGANAPFNTTSDQVNGRVICPANNTNANMVPGCDMSGDVGLNDSGTPDDLYDDYYTGDMIVRTNDSFTVRAGWHWHGTAGGAEEQVTLVGTLPSGVGFVWYELPGYCDVGAGSNISSDHKTITCVRKDFDTNDVGDYAEDSQFDVKAESDTPDGTQPGYIAFSVDTPQNESSPATDTTETSNAADQDKMIVTASPRWNLDFHDSADRRAVALVTSDTDANGDEGRVVTYIYNIEADQVPGETDTFAYPALGNAALEGIDNVNLTITADINISPNAELYTWGTNNSYSPQSNPCDMDSIISPVEPYPSLPAGTVSDIDRYIRTPVGTATVNCTDNGDGTLNIDISGIDSRLTFAPTKQWSGSPLPESRKIAALGVFRVFVPLDDIKDGNDGVRGTSDDNRLDIHSCITDFVPLGAGGGHNFGGNEESEADNCNTYRLTYTPPQPARHSYHAEKYLKRGWSDQADQKLLWGGGIWSQLLEGASIPFWTYSNGDGIVTGNMYLGASFEIYNNGHDYNETNVTICDVIDTNRYSMELIDPDTDNPSTVLDDTIHAVDIELSSVDKSTVKISYGIGYVGAWPPDPFAPEANATAQECNISASQWYDDYVSAKIAADAAGTTVTKVKAFVPLLETGFKRLQVRIKLKTRSTHLNDSTYIENNELLVNYTSYALDDTNGEFQSTNYIAKDANTSIVFSGIGDRAIFQKAIARIDKTMPSVGVSPGVDSNVTLKPTFVTPNGVIGDTAPLYITDVLPKGLRYIPDTTEGVYGEYNTSYPEPVVIPHPTDAECNQYASAIVEMGQKCGTLNGGTGDESILYWDLGTLVIGSDFGPLFFKVKTTIDAPVGPLVNFAQIESPADGSLAVDRTDDASVNNSVPLSLLSLKEIEVSKHEVNTDSLLDWMVFKVGVRNGSADDSLTDLDIVDIIPFNGDGVSGSYTFTPQAGDTTYDMQRTPESNFHGTFQFSSMSFDDNGGQCDSGSIEYWYTEYTGVMDIAPTSNETGGSANWCQGTDAGPIASCGFSNNTVTAVRVKGIDMDAGATCFWNIKFATQNNADGDIYANSASAKGTGVTNAVMTNIASARAYLSSIGDTVWLDDNEDGIQDVGEDGIENIVLKLYDENNIFIAQTTTNSYGKYLFPNLKAGEYVIEVFPGGHNISPQNATANEATDSDFDTSTHKTDIIVLDRESRITNVDVGLYGTAITPTITGNVYDDGNGDNNINGDGIGTTDGTQLYVTLLDSNNAAVASKAVAADGSYTFNDADGVAPDSSYTIVLSTTQNSTTAALLANWNNADGENINSAGTGNDGTPDGRLSVAVASSNVTGADFGINKKPTADDKSQAAQPNPGGSTTVTVPTLTGADQESATLSYTIKTLPSNATLYYNGTAITAANFVVADPTLLTVDPDDGSLTVTFTYTTTDEADVVSQPATVTIPFMSIGITGNIYDDGNGDNNINGDGIGTTDGTQLYVTLLDSNNAAVASKAVAADGSYTFNDADGVAPDSSYTIVLSTTQNSTTAALLANWNNADGENINSAGTGNDGTPDGRLSVAVASSNVTGADFGINKKPTADDANSTMRRNPAGEIHYPVPTLPVSDVEDGTPTTVTISKIPDPKTGILYYDGNPVVEGEEIPNFDITKLTVDPTEGSPTVLFSYTATDAGGAESSPANVSMPFTDITHIGDYFWVDVNNNGLQDAGERPFGGAKVELLDGDGNKLYWTDGSKTDLTITITEYPAEEITTKDEGKYGFDVHPGEYQLRFTIPDDMLRDGYEFSPENQGDDALDTDVNENGVVVLRVDAGKDDFTIDAGITCGCAGVSSDSIDALNPATLFAMILSLLLFGLVFVHRDEKIFNAGE